MLRIDDDPLEMDDLNLDLLAFPEIVCYGKGGERGFRKEKALPLLITV